MNDEDRLTDALRALPAHDAPPDVSDRVRRRAHAELALQRDYANRPWRGALAIAWSRVAMPVALATVVGVYLVLAFRFVGALYR